MKTLRFLAILAACATGIWAAEPTVEDAKKFLDTAEKRLFDLSLEANQAAWIQSTYITDDTEAVEARANERNIAEAVRLAKGAVRFDKLNLPPDMRRKMNLLKNGLVLAAPANPAESGEVTRLAASLEGRYGKGQYCPESKAGAEQPCMDIEAVTRVMASSNNPAELLDAWRGWHRISPPMRKDFQRFVELSNKGARELGFKDTGAMWRSKYDMPADDFAKEVDRLWEQVRPLYISLHSYVRWKLREKYGADVVPANGPIPAHLLGNIWAQDWSNVYKLAAPADADKGYDLTEILKKRDTKPVDMVHYGENFFKSLGFAPLPQTFWERSMFSKPRDRDVVCHASAWDIDAIEDVRIKACLDITDEDFTTVHHELGHNFYQRAYDKQPFIFRDSANDGFHEAIGDTIALSVTPEYLVKIGLLDKAPDASKDIGLLLARALEKVAFLPFGLMIDQWRWKVFSGEIPPDQYNKGWWDLRLKYQGVAPSIPRSENDFDPGAKYHVAADVPYTRYFLSYIMQFQFHRALAKAAGCPAAPVNQLNSLVLAAGSNTPLHRCSIYGNQEAGRRLNAMLEMGLSKPWQDAMFELTGQRNLDATAILDYFAPLKKWLDEQNKGKPSGW
jgi:peptidyl-dipeptidase A